MQRLNKSPSSSILDEKVSDEKISVADNSPLSASADEKVSISPDGSNPSILATQKFELSLQPLSQPKPQSKTDYIGMALLVGRYHDQYVAFIRSHLSKYANDNLMWQKDGKTVNRNILVEDSELTIVLKQSLIMLEEAERGLYLLAKDKISWIGAGTKLGLADTGYNIYLALDLVNQKISQKDSVLKKAVKRFLRALGQLGASFIVVDRAPNSEIDVSLTDAIKGFTAGFEDLVRLNGVLSNQVRIHNGTEVIGQATSVVTQLIGWLTENMNPANGDNVSENEKKWLLALKESLESSQLDANQHILHEEKDPGFVANIKALHNLVVAAENLRNASIHNWAQAIQEVIFAYQACVKLDTDQLLDDSKLLREKIIDGIMVAAYKQFAPYLQGAADIALDLQISQHMRFGALKEGLREQMVRFQQMYLERGLEFNNPYISKERTQKLIDRLQHKSNNFKSEIINHETTLKSLEEVRGFLDRRASRFKSKLSHQEWAQLVCNARELNKVLRIDSLQEVPEFIRLFGLLSQSDQSAKQISSNDIEKFILPVIDRLIQQMQQQTNSIKQKKVMVEHEFPEAIGILEAELKQHDQYDQQMRRGIALEILRAQGLNKLLISLSVADPFLPARSARRLAFLYQSVTEKEFVAKSKQEMTDAAREIATKLIASNDTNQRALGVDLILELTMAKAVGLGEAVAILKNTEEVDAKLAHANAANQVTKYPTRDALILSMNNLTDEQLGDQLNIHLLTQLFAKEKIILSELDSKDDIDFMTVLSARYEAAHKVKPSIKDIEIKEQPIVIKSAKAVTQPIESKEPPLVKAAESVDPQLAHAIGVFATRLLRVNKNLNRDLFNQYGSMLYATYLKDPAMKPYYGEIIVLAHQTGNFSSYEDAVIKMSEMIVHLHTAIHRDGYEKELVKHEEKSHAIVNSYLEDTKKLIELFRVTMHEGFVRVDSDAERILGKILSDVACIANDDKARQFRACLFEMKQKNHFTPQRFIPVLNAIKQNELLDRAHQTDLIVKAQAKIAALKQIKNAYQQDAMNQVARLEQGIAAFERVEMPLKNRCLNLANLLNQADSLLARERNSSEADLLAKLIMVKLENYIATRDGFVAKAYSFFGCPLRANKINLAKEYLNSFANLKNPNRLDVYAKLDELKMKHYTLSNGAMYDGEFGRLLKGLSEDLLPKPGVPMAPPFNLS